MNNVLTLRPFQSAAKYRGNPQLYARLIREIRADQAKGLSGHLVLHEARTVYGTPPKGVA